MVIFTRQTVPYIQHNIGISLGKRISGFSIMKLELCADTWLAMRVQGRLLSEDGMFDSEPIPDWAWFRPNSLSLSFIIIFILRYFLHI